MKSRYFLFVFCITYNDKQQFYYRILLPYFITIIISLDF